MGETGGLVTGLPLASQIAIDFPPKMECLFRPKRYKVFYGGRGSAKSWSIARALIILAIQRPLRVLCVREMQNSMAESVHKLLSDQIAEMEQSGLFEIQRDKIYGPNGSSFSFEGIRNNSKKIKSYEGIDICWVEEGDNLSEVSMTDLVPTIRKEGSEIWISFNPQLATDYVYKNYVVRPQPDSDVVFVSWRDNPWFPTTLHKEMLELKDRDYDKYLNVWEGQCRELLTGAVYADELRAAALAKRICRVPYDPSCPVDTFWDLGWADHTAIWFRQRVGFEWHYIDYLSDTQKALNHYLGLLQERPYIYGTHWLPHDARNRQIGTGMSIEERMRRTHKVRIVKRLHLVDGIDAARTIFPNCYFDEAACADGIRALRSYRYEIADNNVGALSRAPVHDWSSHGADAFRYSAVATKQPRHARGDEEGAMPGAPGRFAPRQGREIELDPHTGMPIHSVQVGGTPTTGWLR